MIWKNAIQSYQEVLFREQEYLKLRYRVSNKKKLCCVREAGISAPKTTHHCPQSRKGIGHGQDNRTINSLPL